MNLLPQPVIVVDSREQAPLTFHTLQAVVGSLQTGDYSVAGLEHLFAIERKSVADLVGCCMGQNRDRFERELHRLRGFRFKRSLIVGVRAEVDQHRYRSGISPQSVLHTLAAFEVRYEVPVVWEPDTEAAARRIESWAVWFAREVAKDADALAGAAQAGSGAAQKKKVVPSCTGRFGT
jgi:ERCC4-type nuclease